MAAKPEVVAENKPNYLPAALRRKQAAPKSTEMIQTKNEFHISHNNQKPINNV